MTAIATLAQTPIYDWHAAHGGRLVNFAGWAMPVQYGSIVEEHHATRKAVGLFDVSHMGRLQLQGTDAGPLLESVLTRRVGNLKPGQVRYSLVCNESGGVLDDVLAYRVDFTQLAAPRAATDDPSQLGFGMVVNASNRAKIVAHLQQHAAGRDVTIDDVTNQYAMLAVQGPKAIELLDPVTDCELTAFRYYTGEVANFRLTDSRSVSCFISRTGYTGEDGCEIICPAADALAVWEKLVELAGSVGGGAVGLAARDTLRLEAGMPLYGHELTESINPIQAGLSFAVNFKDREFIGHDALLAASRDASQPVRIGLQLEGRRPAREGAKVLQGDQVVGELSSGTFSPTFDRPLAMAYAKPSASSIGDHVAVDIRGKEVAATVVPLPFYERGK